MGVGAGGGGEGCPFKSTGLVAAQLDFTVCSSYYTSEALVWNGCFKLSMTWLSNPNYLKNPSICLTIPSQLLWLWLIVPRTLLGLQLM